MNQLLLEALSAAPGSRPSRQDLLMQLLAAQTATGDDVIEAAAEIDPRPSAPVDERDEQIEALLAHCDELEHRNRYFAHTLGACSRCWGESFCCPQCGGDGTPGWRRPDADGLMELIRPVLDRVSAGRSAARRGAESALAAPPLPATPPSQTYPSQSYLSQTDRSHTKKEQTP